MNPNGGDAQNNRKHYHHNNRKTKSNRKRNPRGIYFSSYESQGQAMARSTVSENSWYSFSNPPEPSEHAPENQQVEEYRHSSSENQACNQQEDERRCSPVLENQVFVRHEAEYRYSSVSDNQAYVRQEEERRYSANPENHVYIRHEEEYHFSPNPENRGYVRQEDEYRHPPTSGMAFPAHAPDMALMRPLPVYVPARVPYDPAPPAMPQEMRYNMIQYLPYPIVFGPYFPINIDQLTISNVYIAPDQNARPNINACNFCPHNVPDN